MNQESSQQVSVSLLDPAVQQCPFPVYKELREKAPVYKTETPSGEMYIVTSYDLLMEVLKNPRVYSNLAPDGLRAGLYNAEAERIIKEEGYGRFMPTIVNNDAPGHTAYRALVNDAFRAGRVRQMEAYIKEVVDDLVDAFADKGECEAVADFAVPVPMYVIADQLGVPRSEFKRFKEWSDAWVIGLGMPVGEDVLIDAARKVVEMQHYMIARMHERREAPQDDIMSDLVQSTIEDGRLLEDKEVLSIVEQILVAGNETTTNGIANGLLKLASDQDLQQRLRDNPDEIKKFVEEILRWESPVQGLFRYVKEDTELGGVKIPKGASVMVRYASGNRDECKFANSEEFDLDRKNSGAHIAFGSGIHHCVGSQLARAEMIASFEAFLNRFSSFELAVPETEIKYHFSFALRGPAKLPIRFTV